MKTKIDIYEDGSVAYSELPAGFDVEIHNTKVGDPVETIKNPDKEIVAEIKNADGKVKYNFKAHKIEAGVVDEPK